MLIKCFIWPIRDFYRGNGVLHGVHILLSLRCDRLPNYSVFRRLHLRASKCKMTIVKRLNLYEDKTWSVWAKFQFSASPQTLPTIASRMQTDRCDSVNTDVQLIAFRQSCFPLTMKMWLGIDHKELLKDPKQNSGTKLRVSEERVLLNIWT